MSEPLVKPRTSLMVFGALIALTVVTVALAYVNLGPLHGPVGLVIAGVKATLILVFFMHWLHTYPLTRVAALSGLLWLAILIVLALTDFLTREWPMAGSR